MALSITLTVNNADPDTIDKILSVIRTHVADQGSEQLDDNNQRIDFSYDGAKEQSKDTVKETVDCDDNQISIWTPLDHNTEPQPASGASSTIELKQDQDPTPSSITSSAEFPNGTHTWTMEVEEGVKPYLARSVGWAMGVYGKNKSNTTETYFKYCLGIYQCPHCQFTEKPRVPTAKKSKYAPPLPPRSSCILHDCELRHIPCDALLKIRHRGQVLSFEHKGFHNHARPSTFRPDLASMNKFEEIVKIAGEVAQLVGTATRPSITEIHPSFLNLDRTAYHRRNILRQSAVSLPIGALAAFEEGVGEKVIRSSSLEVEDGHISL
ncbi:hypothetical protein BGW38_010372 [Lunasporangiospora selenospora]|uniref:Uncharacterized protein n=1 Tax=Lunasporangiospora selenospora TaxID=979761 RepID=A0A9P6FWK0_9FUNG|nr:hypothetical protein BGW38_010372 [Lunasporangiospora selenospora]